MVFSDLFCCSLDVLPRYSSGKGTAPVKFDIEKLQKKLAALKAEDINEKLTRFKIGSDFDKHKADLDFYEDLKKGRDDIRPPPPTPVLKSKKNPFGEKQKKTSKKTVPDKNKSSDKSIHKDNILLSKKNTGSNLQPYDPGCFV